MGGTRFVISGLVLYTWARLHGVGKPTRLEWRNTAIVGACLLSANAVAHQRPPLQHVTIFGDSAASALYWDPQARQEVEKAISGGGARVVR